MLPTKTFATTENSDFSLQIQSDQVFHLNLFCKIPEIEKISRFAGYRGSSNFSEICKRFLVSFWISGILFFSFETGNSFRFAGYRGVAISVKFVILQDTRHPSLPFCWISGGYGAATISRLHTIIGLFCKRALQKRLYSAKETYNFKEPTLLDMGGVAFSVKLSYSQLQIRRHRILRFFLNVGQRTIILPMGLTLSTTE